MELGENDLLTKCFVEQSLGDYILFAESVTFPTYSIPRLLGCAILKEPKLAN